jgi:hypothetical protein
MTITTIEYINKIDAWSMDVHAKTLILDKGSRFYLGFGWLSLMLIGALNVTLIALNVTFLSADMSETTRLAINIVVLILQVFLAVATVVDKVVQPLKRSNDLSMCSKFYDQLIRRLEICKSRAMDNNYEENYEAEMTELVMQEQLIHQLEPGMVFIGRPRPVIKNYVSDQLPMTLDEIDWISSLINKHHGRKRDKLIELFNRILQLESSRIKASESI